MEREKTEWCQFYWFDTSETTLPRVLLVGDSIVAGSRQYVADCLRGAAVVAAFSTSKIVGDPAIYRELSLALSDYHIDLIYLNNGLHGLTCTDDFYRNGLADLIAVLKQSTKATLAWRSSTPISVINKPETLDPVNNSIVVRRNQIAAEIMARNNIPVDDLYQAVVNHPELRSNDGYHYTPDGAQFIAEHTAKFIRKMLV
jgi:lysophospholipase L1-like esterase